MKETEIKILELVRAIVTDMRKNGFKCDACLEKFPEVEDLYTGEIRTLPVPYLHEVTLDRDMDNKTIGILSEFTTFPLYHLHRISYTKDNPNPLILATFKDGYNIRNVLFESHTYEIIRNDFVEIVKTKLDDYQSKKYKYDANKKRRYF
mgnify:CR=1 FL=1